LKLHLYSRLAGEGFSLKDWFVQRAREYMAERDQPSLPGISVATRRPEVMLAAEDPIAYKTSMAAQR
jgi:hypothetical protein